ncbi:MAG TPA: hypothetical protein VG147_10795 [Solirubrobacteraceae bacterium]|nr:hypothetical protein [Solirubrobacteraceae bacterium]
MSIVSLLLALVSFAGCVAGGLWLVGELAAHRDSGDKVPVTARAPDDPWIAQLEGSIAGTHVWAGRTAEGVLRSPVDCAAIVVGPPRSGKTRKVIAPTLGVLGGAGARHLDEGRHPRDRRAPRELRPGRGV